MHPLYILVARSVAQLLNCFSNKHGVPNMQECLACMECLACTEYLACMEFLACLEPGVHIPHCLLLWMLWQESLLPSSQVVEATESRCQVTLATQYPGQLV